MRRSQPSGASRQRTNSRGATRRQGGFSGACLRLRTACASCCPECDGITTCGPRDLLLGVQGRFRFFESTGFRQLGFHLAVSDPVPPLRGILQEASACGWRRLHSRRFRVSSPQSCRLTVSHGARHAPTQTIRGVEDQNSGRDLRHHAGVRDQESARREYPSSKGCRRLSFTTLASLDQFGAPWLRCGSLIARELRNHPCADSLNQ